MLLSWKLSSGPSLPYPNLNFFLGHLLLVTRIRMIGHSAKDNLLTMFPLLCHPLSLIVQPRLNLLVVLVLSFLLIVDLVVAKEFDSRIPITLGLSS